MRACSFRPRHSRICGKSRCCYHQAGVCDFHACRSTFQIVAVGVNDSVLGHMGRDAELSFVAFGQICRAMAYSRASSGTARYTLSPTMKYCLSSVPMMTAS